MTQETPKASFWAAFTSWRLGAVTLLSLSSGLPLGLVITAVPAWLAVAGVDIKTIGLITLVQLPYGFKFVWSPLLDRLRPPFLGSRRGWILITQLSLGAVVAALGWLAASLPTCAPGSEACKALPTPDAAVITAVAALSFLIAFASASQDIVYDAYAVEVLQKHEHGAAVGARSALSRAGMWLSGNIAITLGPHWGRPQNRYREKAAQYRPQHWLQTARQRRSGARIPKLHAAHRYGRRGQLCLSVGRA